MKFEIAPMSLFLEWLQEMNYAPPKKKKPNPLIILYITLLIFLKFHSIGLFANPNPVYITMHWVEQVGLT